MSKGEIAVALITIGVVVAMLLSLGVGQPDTEKDMCHKFCDIGGQSVRIDLKGVCVCE